MTRDDIIRMAREAGLTQKPFCRWGGYLDDLMRFATLVAAAEREECARVCERMARQINEEMMSEAQWIASSCARGIRERGDRVPDA